MTNRLKNIASRPPSFARRQIELPVVHALAHVAAVVELPIDDVDVGIEDERVLMERACAVGRLGPDWRRERARDEPGEMSGHAGLR